MGGVVRGDETDIAVRRGGDDGGGGGGHVRGDDGGFCAEPAAPGFGTMDSVIRFHKITHRCRHLLYNYYFLSLFIESRYFLSLSYKEEGLR